MSTKGSWKRPYDDSAWGSNFERIFGKKVAPIRVTVPDDLPGRSTAASASAGELMGRGVVANMSLSKSEALGSEPSAPANQGNE